MGAGSLLGPERAGADIAATSATEESNPSIDAPNVRDVSLEVGATETSRNLSWLSTSSETSYVEFVAKPAAYEDGSSFPEEGAVRVAATGTEAQRTGYTAYKATITDIQENTTYLYRVGNDAAWSPIAEFTSSAQGASSTFTFLLAGDPQIGANSTSSDTAGWSDTLSLADALNPAFMISVGDQVNDKQSDDQYDNYFSAAGLTSLAQAVSVGNHDVGNTRYSDYFNLPNVSSLGARTDTGSMSGDYWFTYNGVLFMVLNSNNEGVAMHRQFMQEAIAQNPDATWKIVAFHHSVFSLARHYGDKDVVDLRNTLPQIFSELGIDAVLMGHDHYFTRTYMMNGTTPVVPEGNDVSAGEPVPTEVRNPAAGEVLYLTANSSSGSKYYPMNENLSTSALPGYVAAQDQSSRKSITSVIVSAQSLSLDTYYADNGELTKMDSFTIKRTDAPAITAPADGTLEASSTFDPMEGVSAASAEGDDLTDLVHVSVTD
ncbi:purple acid phosphatase family protein [Collinsella vaginalis]|uniref:purple acid phosphatase family protein n=1 Tax=Collinsella vaginalis TaxID=1870987 RepID=UPI000A266DED|nr:metallophosphoesterase family protein [Collinsella vaginalis]